MINDSECEVDCKIPGFKVISLFIDEEKSKFFLKKSENSEILTPFFIESEFKKLKVDTSNKVKAPQSGTNKYTIKVSSYLPYRHSLKYEGYIVKYYPPFNFDIRFVKVDSIFNARYGKCVASKTLEDGEVSYRCHIRGLICNSKDKDFELDYINELIKSESPIEVNVSDVDIYSRILVELILPNGENYSTILLNLHPVHISPFRSASR
jgi:hypothetical protein